MAEGYWAIRTYRAGNIGEKTKYWVPGPRPTKSRRKLKSEIKKQEQNEYSAIKRCARAINDNFGPGDWLIGLDYSEEGLAWLMDWARGKGMGPETEDEEEFLTVQRKAAEWALENCLRRVKRELEKEGKELKYLAVTSDMDGDTGEVVRIHHHIVIPRECREAFVRKWQEMGWGTVDWAELGNQDDYLPVAEYLLRQVRKIPYAKKYKPSRNLVQPEPKDRAALTDGELRVPGGAVLLYRSEFKRGCPQYIRYILPEKQCKRPRAKERGDRENDGYRTGARTSAV